MTYHTIELLDAKRPYYLRVGRGDMQSIPLLWAEDLPIYEPTKLEGYVDTLKENGKNLQDSAYSIGVGSHVLLGIPYPHFETLREVADKEVVLCGYENKFEVKVGAKTVLALKHSTRELPTPYPRLVLPEPLNSLSKILAVGLLHEEAVRAAIQKLKISSAVVYEDCGDTIRSLENVADGIQVTCDRLRQRLAERVTPFWYQQMDAETWGTFKADLMEAQGFLRGWY